jgi:hypothetical protein
MNLASGDLRFYPPSARGATPTEPNIFDLVKLSQKAKLAVTLSAAS